MYSRKTTTLNARNLQLVSMKWQLGVAMSSDSCRTLNSPQVTLQFRVAGTEGVSTVHTVEMTISEFQVSSSLFVFEPVFYLW